ncbi:MAG: imidazolonepropionase [Gemmatimonadaceae bacterium]|nr:imidazolonepropionase [Gemmatimonadaceae bacterium]
MIADQLLTNVSQLVTAPGRGARRGAAMRDLEITRDAAVAITNGRVMWCGARTDWNGTAKVEIDAAGCAVVPGLVDPHTHVVWGGDRLADFEARTSGVTYEQVLASGGGIRHTVACTNATAAVELLALAQARVVRMMRAGATTIEVKSGYGFTWDNERRQLDAVRALSAHVPAQLVATMLFHLPPRDPRDRLEYMQHAVREFIPDLARDGAATAVDVFIERDAFSVDEADMLLRAARHVGLACKAHVDQFSAIGGLELAVQHGALSVDHLEASGPAQIAALATVTTVGVVLPGVTLHLGLRAAPARALVDAGAAVAVGTDCNPGSSPLFSMSLAMALAVRLNGLTPAEAFSASTANAAAALGLTHVGRLAPTMCADFLILHGADWRDLPYTLGEDAVDRVFIAGDELLR